jgi:hypothetical protein
MALEELGFGKCYHMKELYSNLDEVVEWERALRGEEPDWDAIFSGYQATVDFPGCLYYSDLIKEYPDAKVILTYRDPTSWYESAYSTILTMRPSFSQYLKIFMYYFFSDRARKVLKVDSYTIDLIEKRFFGGRTKDKQHTINVFKQHLEEVTKTVPSNSLLIYQVSEGWEPLCRFLGVPVPEIKFPISNLRGNFDKDIRDTFFSLSPYGAGK